MSTPPAPADLPEFPPMAEPKPKKSMGKRLLRGLGFLVGAVVALLVFGWFVKDDPSIAEAGQCVHNAGSDTKPDVAIVDCGSTKAEFKVLKVIRSSDDSQCQSIEGFTASYVVTSSDSYTLCLGKNG